MHLFIYDKLLYLPVKREKELRDTNTVTQIKVAHTPKSHTREWFCGLNQFRAIRKHSNHQWHHCTLKPAVLPTGAACTSTAGSLEMELSCRLRCPCIR